MTPLLPLALASSAALTPQPTATASGTPSPEQIVQALTASLPRTDASAANATITPEMRPYIEAMGQAALLLEELNNTLRGVNDKSSADAAAPQLAATLRKVKALEQRYKHLPKPSPELRDRLYPIIMKRHGDAAREFAIRLFTIAAAKSYGSEAFRNALQEINR